MSVPETKNPSLLGVAFFAVVMAVVGASFGFLLLATIPSKAYATIADYQKATEKSPEGDSKNTSQKKLQRSYHFEGSKASGSVWVQKREMLLTANDEPLVLTDSEINSWATYKLKKLRLSFSDKERPSVFMVLGAPNFFIDETDGVHFSIAVEVVTFGMRIQSMLIGKGSFSGEDGSEFNLNEFRLNDARIPYAEKMYDDLLDALLESFQKSEEFALIKEAWEKVDSVELVGNGIRLNLD